jgi:hypothetical protein
MVPRVAPFNDKLQEELLVNEFLASVLKAQSKIDGLHRWYNEIRHTVVPSTRLRVLRLPRYGKHYLL